MKVTVSNPVNLSSDHKHLFADNIYSLPELSVYSRRNVFCTPEGICLSQGKLLSEHVHSYPKVRRSFWLRALRIYLAARITRRAPTLKLDSEREYLIIHHPWLNYYHWMLDCLPRLLLVQDRINDLTLILPESYKSATYVQESLRAFEVTNIEYTPHGTSLILPRVVVPEIRPESKLFNPAELSQLKSILIDALGTNSDREINERIFLSREDAKLRSISNMEETHSVFKEFDFSIQTLSTLTLSEQVALMQGAGILAGLHGAGFTNLLFTPKSCRVFELLKLPTAKTDFFPDMYWYLSSALELDYYYQVCEPVDPSVHVVQADILVDLKELRSNLEKLISF